ncbi:hypothetical protein [Rubellicoccus peritrichatus]|uniref:Uncharacterized protein n=1 Tax=Rubellicoccus peritrichatus TaxID=3080537 RepID=A0AAQ3QTF0_9BACT|nr:hypothetical protein [Puniceicoccus sp. CR14]WOO41266.1 hypothetical protein RZN69_21815 [Puniceicoccus sp. CR14]
MKKVVFVIAVLVVALSAISYLLLSKYSHSPRNEKVSGKWYGLFDDNIERRYDWIAERRMDGSVNISFRWFDSIEYSADGPNRVINSEEAIFDSRIEEIGSWGADSTHYYTSTEHADASRVSLVHKIMVYIHSGYWESNDDFEETYLIKTLNNESFVYENLRTGREFWNVRVSEDFDFPPLPMTKEEALSKQSGL